MQMKLLFIATVIAFAIAMWLITPRGPRPPGPPAGGFA